MVLRTQFNNRLDERPGVLGIYIRRNAVAEVEYVTRAGAVATQDIAYFLTNTLFRRIEHGGIHIALQSHTIAHASTSVADVRGPIQTNGISP